ncbi:penicillin acylase family protein [Pseudobowmanella zhangzhouensis]|uniref:penicillin acylase family protein n=1 Tax=Pseudobowmanella zhangzhouensis TaxID=1537679 RepID=UPI00361DB531
MSRARLFIYSLSGILLLCIACLYLLLRASLPALDGQVKSTYLSDAVTVKRDALGSADIFAQSRDDLAFATGYVHGQERFFQMDLMRRNAAANWRN